MSKSETLVHRATPEDADRAAVLFARYRSFYRRELNESSASAFLHERLTLSQSVVLLAERQGRTVGFLQLYPGFSSIYLAPIWRLNDLFVEDSERRTGVAGALIEEAEKLALNAGAVSLILETAEDNTGARRLYEAQGFVLSTDFLTYVKPLR